MRLFSKTSVSNPTPSEHPDDFSLWLKDRKGHYARKLASFLSRHEQNLTTRQKKGILASFCLLMLCYSFGIIAHAFFYPHTAAPYLEMPTITLPQSGRLPDSWNPKIQKLLKSSPLNGRSIPDSVTK